MLQVYIYKDLEQDFCLEIDGVWDKRISNVVSAKVSVCGFNCFIVSFLVPFIYSGQEGPSDDNLKTFVNLADLHKTEDVEDSDSDSSSSSSEGGTTSNQSSTSASSDRGNDSDSSSSSSDQATCQKKSPKRPGTPILKRRGDPAPVELHKKTRKKFWSPTLEASPPWRRRSAT